MKTPYVQMTTVIRDCRDGRLDYKLPLKRAKELYDAGILSFDMTNGQYCTHTPADKPQ